MSTPVWVGNTSEIRVSYDPPPIPMRKFDWSAARDDYDEGWPIGWGRTKDEAIADLLAQEEMWEP